MQMNGLRASWSRARTRTFDWLDALAARKSSGPKHLATGLSGERQALLHLQNLGYTVVARRWKTARLRGYIDLVAWDGEHLSFIEAKTRSRRVLMWPAEAAVDTGKRRMLRQMAKAYLKNMQRGMGAKPKVRFDLLIIYLSGMTGMEFELQKGAFGWE